MPSTTAAANLAQCVAQYVGPRQRLAQDFTIPSLLLAATSLMLAAYDSWTLQRLSPILLLTVIFLAVAVACATWDVDAKGLDIAYQRWRQMMAVAILGWIFVMFFVWGYHSQLHDMGCIRCGGTVLAVMVARTTREAVGYAVAHFLLVQGAEVAHYPEEMLFLVCTDAFMIYAAWRKENTNEGLEQLTSLALGVSQQSFYSVRETLHHLCDAVVVLDRDLALQEAAPDLESILGRVCASGRNFQDLIYHEDLQSLETTLTDRFTLMEMGDRHDHEVVHARLVDSYGSPISVHVFIAAVAVQPKDIGQPCFLLGVSEQWPRSRIWPTGPLARGMCSTSALEPRPGGDEAPLSLPQGTVVGQHRAVLMGRAGKVQRGRRSAESGQ